MCSCPREDVTSLLFFMLVAKHEIMPIAFFTFNFPCNMQPCFIIKVVAGLSSSSKEKVRVCSKGWARVTERVSA